MCTLEPSVAGQWYPDDIDGLTREVDRLLAHDTPDASRPSLLVVPHAGLRYSGPVAGRTLALLRDAARPRRIVLVGPSHRVAFDGAIVPAASGYRTPLGTVDIDRTATSALDGTAGFSSDDTVFFGEHSLEVQLPLLQRALGRGLTIVPVLVGNLTDRVGPELLADALRPLLDESTCLVVSSDFTHFGAAFGYTPFRNDVRANIERLDHEAIGLIGRRDVAGFEEFLARTGATICGRNPLRVALRLAPPGEPGRLVAYDTSGSVTGDWTHVVSYAGLAFERTAA